MQGYDNTGQLDGKPEADDEVQFSDDEQVQHLLHACPYTILFHLHSIDARISPCCTFSSPALLGQVL